MKTNCISKKVIVTAVMGTILIPGSVMRANAQDIPTLPVAGIETVLGECYLSETEHPIELYLVPTEKEEYSDMAFANVEDFEYIRKEPSDSSEWAGKLYSGGAATVLGKIGAWTQIESGNVTGYVPTKSLYTGGAAKEYASQAISTKATVTAYALNVRNGQNTDAEILTCISMNEQYDVTGEPVDGWYPVQVEEISGWVSGKYITLQTNFSYAESKEEEEERLAKEEAERKAEAEAEAAREAEAQAVAAQAQATVDQVASGQAVIDYACQFIGNPYVWGGTSLTNGADCSGFIQSVYQHFGISLPRTSREMRSAGYEVSYENAMPGDIICYEGHVGLYMGDGTIVNAIDEAHGIGISNAAYTYIITVRRMF